MTNFESSEKEGRIVDEPARQRSNMFSMFGKRANQEMDSEGGQRRRNMQHEAWRLQFRPVEQILHECGASDAHLDFFNLFRKELAEPLMQGSGRKDDSQMRDHGGHYITLSSDMRRLEVHVRVDDSQRLAVGDQVSSFLKTCGLDEKLDEKLEKSRRLCAGRVDRAFECDPAQQNDVMASTTTAYAPSTTMNRSATSKDSSLTSIFVWCVLDCIGSSGDEGFVDAGFFFEWGSEVSPVEWAALEMVLPPSDDKDRLFDYAMAEQACISSIGFSSSILPSEVPNSEGEPVSHHETSLHFRLKDSRSAALTGLLFFKVLGFEQPERYLFNMLAGAKQNEVHVSVSLGPHGLTRATLRLCGVNGSTPQKVAKAMQLPYDETRINEVKRRLCMSELADAEDSAAPVRVHTQDNMGSERSSAGGTDKERQLEPRMVEYTATSRGPLVSLGFREY